MKVLFLSQAFPPYPLVGALRARKIAEMFRDRGHDVTVVTERLEAEKGEIRLSEPHLTVRTVEIGLPYRLRVVAMRNWLLGRSIKLSSWSGPNLDARTSPGSSEPGSPVTRTGALKRLAIGVLRLPDDQQHFIPPAARIGKQAMREGVDLIYTTSPAVSTHLIALILRRRFRVRWVAEFRDPWPADQPSNGRTSITPGLRRINRWFERRCLRGADVLVAVTDSIARDLAAKLPPDQRGKVVVAMNGIDNIQPRREPSQTRTPFRIVHTGSFYLDRDPRPFLTALASWMKDRGLGTEHVRVEFAGHCRYYADVSVEGMVRELGLEEIVHFHDWLDHASIQQMLCDADLLLLLARSQPAQVPNKLFDYLGARTPILAVVDEEGESAAILNAVGGQYVITVHDDSPVDIPTMREMIERAYDHRGESAPTDDSVLEKLLTRKQLEHLATAIGA